MMQKKLFIFIFVCCSATLCAQILPNFGGERAGLSALSFLKNDMNPRSLGMGGSSVALSGDVYSTYTNPAALVDLKETSIGLSHYFLGAGINQSFLSSSFPLADQVSNLAFSINSLNSGSMEERTEFQPMGTGREVFVSNIAVGASYARQLSSLFSAGVTVKYIYEGIAGYSNHNATVDLAFLYRVDWHDLQFAVVIQNFGGNSSLGGTDSDNIPVVFNRQTGVNLDANTVPTVFSLGASITAYEEDKQKIIGSFQLNHPNDNAENIRFGMEYRYSDLLFARAGYKLSVRGQDWPTFGFGVRSRVGGFPLILDYAINPTNFMGFQHMIGLRLNFLNDTRS